MSPLNLVIKVKCQLHRQKRLPNNNEQLWHDLGPRVRVIPIRHCWSDLQILSCKVSFLLFEDFFIELIKLPKEFVAQIKQIPFLLHGFVKRLRFPKSSLFTYVIGIQYRGMMQCWVTTCMFSWLFSQMKLTPCGEDCVVLTFNNRSAVARHCVIQY